MRADQGPNLSQLRARADLLRKLRHFFDARDFLEVQPPCLSAVCIVDPYIDPIEVGSEQFQLAAELPQRYFLQTSPEAAMKRMLAAGAPSIYSIGPVFRSGERGDRHNIEFTMLEWYQVEADIEDAIGLLGALAVTVFGSEGYDVRTYRELFQQRFDFDPIDAPLVDLQRAAQTIDVAFQGADRDSLLDFLMSHCLEPSLGLERPVIVRDYPLSQAALARPGATDPQCAARFELFVSGVELANGYDELRDAAVYRERVRANNQRRCAAGRAPILLDPGWADHVHDGLPPCAGVAVGVDRLLMVLSGADSIDQVLPFPIEQA